MKAAAFVCRASGWAGRSIDGYGTAADFSSVLPYAGVLQAEQQTNRTPVCFFLFAAVPDVSTLRGVGGAIRFYPSGGCAFRR